MREQGQQIAMTVRRSCSGRVWCRLAGVLLIQAATMMPGGQVVAAGASVPLVIAPKTDKATSRLSPINPALIAQACASAAVEQAQAFQVYRVKQVSPPFAVGAAHMGCVVDVAVEERSLVDETAPRQWDAKYQVIIEVPTWRTNVTRVDVGGAEDVALAAAGKMLFKAKTVSVASSQEAVFDIYGRGAASGSRCTVTVSLPEPSAQPSAYAVKRITCK